MNKKNVRQSDCTTHKEDGEILAETKPNLPSLISFPSPGVPYFQFRKLATLLSGTGKLSAHLAGTCITYRIYIL